MKNKINLIELLKDCPEGMELNCTTWENVTFEKVMDNKIFVRRNNKQPKFDNIVVLNEYGCVTNNKDEKCRIFPKGKTTWEGFIPPCKFKAGDVLVSEVGNIVLFSHIDFKDFVHYHCIIPTYSGSFRIEENTSIDVGKYYDCVLANEQQKQKMYDKIKCSGYKYNPQLNKLEKLIEPIFKVGNKIKYKNDERIAIISGIKNNCYFIQYFNTDKSDYQIERILIEDQDKYELVPDKFDITTLKPFESRVLVRNANDEERLPTFWGYYREHVTYRYATTAGIYYYCIPYKGNEYLLGTTDNCNDFYRTWE